VYGPASEGSRTLPGDVQLDPSKVRELDEKMFVDPNLLKEAPEAGDIVIDVPGPEPDPEVRYRVGEYDPRVAYSEGDVRATAGDYQIVAEGQYAGGEVGMEEGMLEEGMIEERGYAPVGRAVIVTDLQRKASIAAGELTIADEGRLDFSDKLASTGCCVKCAAPTLVTKADTPTTAKEFTQSDGSLLGKEDVVLSRCTSGQTSSCTVPRKQGVCASGTKTCVRGVWGTCVAPSPVAEICGNSLDDDCDGTVDEGCSKAPLVEVVAVAKFSCTSGQTSSCTVAGKQGVCASGTKTCVRNSWGACVAPSPVSEVCGNSLDDDCDGSTDEGCAKMIATPVRYIARAVYAGDYVDCASTFGAGYFCIATDTEFQDKCFGRGDIELGKSCLTKSEASGFCAVCY
jgi:hypothetical protein